RFPEETAMTHLFRSRSHRIAPKAAESRPRRPRRLKPALDALEGRMLLSFGGSEQPVNPPSSLPQFNVDNASSANGTSVAVWVDTFSATDHDIFAQRYGKDGAKLGPVIAVDRSGLDSFFPAVAMDPNGDFAVAWENHFTGGDSDIFVSYYDASGTLRAGD